MASSSSSQQPTNLNDEISYIDMSSRNNEDNNSDAFLVGEHCQLEYCNQLTFLPSKCQSCNKLFCESHRSETDHKCENAGAWGDRRRQAILNAPSIGGHKQVRDRNYIPPGTLCSGPTAASTGGPNACRTEIGTSLNTGVHCDSCGRNYCLKHRLKEEHECAARAAELARQRRNAVDKIGDSVENALDVFKNRFTQWRAQQKEKSSGKKSFFRPRTSPAAERMKLMNEIKKTAKGDQKLPADKRVYLVVTSSEPNSKGKYPKGYFFYSKDWVVGRLLDAAAKAMQVENVNNRTDDGKERLSVFHVEGEKFLGFSEKLGAALQNGHRVVLTRGGAPPDEVIAILLS
ncbi:AN1-type zinc finger protein-like protein [Zalerion maritima]|uniref:AN1-type zinc finger protein-like protein n=1 Tax=Zalerion maritima TaxID=339359 RepID=A0AAD5S6J5_9PEZI|nr:AN1-type zinc finger protein-like protein [Zalerion maritima]